MQSLRWGFARGCSRELAMCSKRAAAGKSIEQLEQHQVKPHFWLEKRRSSATVVPIVL